MATALFSTIAVSSYADEKDSFKNVFNEYEYYQAINNASKEELEQIGLDKQDVNAFSSTFEDNLYERAIMSDSELCGLGYTEQEIALLRKYAQGSELSDAEMRAISGTCTTYFKLSYASRRIASFYYEWTWDHCPLSPLNDSVAIEWTAYGYDGDTVDLIVERKSSSIAYYWETEPKDDFRYSVPGELETNLSFDGLCLKVPVLGESDIGSGVPAVFYAKTGYVGVDLKVDESVSRDIYFIQASGLYGHTQVGIGFPSVSLTNGKLSFGGNLSVNEIGRRKVEIYNDGTIKYV